MISKSTTLVFIVLFISFFFFVNANEESNDGISLRGLINDNILANTHAIDIVYCKDYLFYSTDYRENVVIKANATTNQVVTVFGTLGKRGDSVSSSLSSGPSGVLFNAPIGLACDSNKGIVYIADSNNNVIKAIDINTDSVAYVAGTGYARSIDDDYEQDVPLDQISFTPFSLSLHSNGNKLYLSSGSNFVSVINFSTNDFQSGFQGNFTTIAKVQSIASYVTLDESRSKLYVSVHLNGIQTIDLLSNPISFSNFQVSISQMSSDVYGLFYLSSSDTLYVCDYDNYKVFSINIASSSHLIWDQQTSGFLIQGTSTSSSFSRPTNVDYGNGKFYIIDELHKVLTFVPLICSGNGYQNSDGSCECYSGYYSALDCSIAAPGTCVYHTLNDVRKSAPIPILQANLQAPMTYSSNALHLTFKSDLYTSRTTKMGFYGQQPTCNATWSYSLDPTGDCKDVFDVNLPFSGRSNCGFAKKSVATDAPNYIYWRGRVQATTKDISGQVKGIPIRLQTKSTIKVAVRFPTSVALSTLGLNVMSSIGMEAALTSQEIIFPEEGNPILHITFDTFVDSPYQVNSFVPSNVPGGYITYGVPSTSSVECNNNVCINHHDISFDLGSLSCQVNGQFIFTATGNCSTPVCGSSQSDLVFTIISEDYCAEALTDVDISGSLESYADAARSQQITALISGNPIYLTATLNGATVQTASVESIFVTSPGSSNAVEFYNVASVNNTISPNFQSYNLVSKSIDFDFIIDSRNFPVISSPSAYSISVVLQVTFQDATKRTLNLEVFDGFVMNEEVIKALQNDDIISAQTRSILEMMSGKSSEMQLALKSKFVLRGDVDEEENNNENDKRLLFEKASSSLISSSFNAKSIAYVFAALFSSATLALVLFKLNLVSFFKKSSSSNSMV